MSITDTSIDTLAIMDDKLVRLTEQTYPAILGDAAYYGSVLRRPCFCECGCGYVELCDDDRDEEIRIHETLVSFAKNMASVGDGQMLRNILEVITRHRIYAAGVYEAALREGHLDCLKIAMEYKCEENDKVCSMAAQFGDLATLKWARSQNCPWSSHTCASAAIGGEIQILQWLVTNGCPWDVKTREAAIYMGEMELLEWAQENGCP